MEGKQYSFVLEGMWHSDVPPRTGMAVDVVVDPQGTPQAIFALSESQLAAEKANQALADAKKQGGALAEKTLRRFGLGTVIGLAALLVGWFLLSSFSVSYGTGEGLDFTFWQSLGFANESHAMANFGELGPGVSPGKGIFGLLALVALAGPLVRFYWRDRRAALAGLLPLLLMALAFYILRSHVIQTVGITGRIVGTPIATRMMNEFMQHISFGAGLYVSFASCLYFAFISAKKFLAGSIG
jgi:hypothetical protein